MIRFCLFLFIIIIMTPETISISGDLQALLSGNFQQMIAEQMIPMLKTMAILVPIFIFVLVWEAVWKTIAMRKAARNNQLPCFLCLLILNTAGILPILYIFVFQPKKEKTPGEEMMEIKKESNMD